MPTKDSGRSQGRVLPWLLVLAVVVLISQIFDQYPRLWFYVHWWGDMRHWDWSRHTWLWIFVGFCTALIVIRFVPDWWDAWRDRCSNHHSESVEAGSERPVS